MAHKPSRTEPVPEVDILPLVERAQQGYLDTQTALRIVLSAARPWSFYLSIGLGLLAGLFSFTVTSTLLILGRTAADPLAPVTYADQTAGITLSAASAFSVGVVVATFCWMALRKAVAVNGPQSRR